MNEVDQLLMRAGERFRSKVTEPAAVSMPGIRSGRRRWRAPTAMAAGLAAAVVAGVVVLPQVFSDPEVTAPSGVASPAPPTGTSDPHKTAPPTPPSPMSSGAPCASSVRTGVLPTWAQGGFTPPTQTMPYVLGVKGDIIAILFTQPLSSPPRPGRANKILWVSRVERGSDALKIEAKLEGSSVAATRKVAGGPGPSTIDLPASGCWSFALSWSGHVDHMNIPYYTS